MPNPFQTIQFSMGTVWKFQAIQFSQIVLIPLNQISVSIDFLYTQLNTKIFLY